MTICLGVFQLSVDQGLPDGAVRGGVITTEYDSVAIRGQGFGFLGADEAPFGCQFLQPAYPDQAHNRVIVHDRYGAGRCWHGVVELIFRLRHTPIMPGTPDEKILCFSTICRYSSDS